jgi:serine protease Do
LHTASPAEIAARATPSIVSIRTEHSLGTGFVVRGDGWIATNLHVLVGGARVLVTLTDKREFAVVEVLAANPGHDLALVRVDATGLPTLLLGDSTALRPGDPIVAIGHPLGLEDTVSNGLVSAVRTADDGSKVLQISAPIAPGSSGGPIFNDHGEVVGVAAAIITGGQNLNFGIPIDYLKPMMASPSPLPIADFVALLSKAQQHLPAVQRSVPHHPLTVLAGCTVDAQKLVFKTIEEAIEVGAPLYNEGNFPACFHIYEGAAIDLERKLPSACKGPARALGDGRKKAAGLTSPSAQAWAMRDAFDGLLEVILRKHGGGED